MSNARTREEEIAADLRKRILDEEWPGDTLLPTSDELALAYDVGKGTISRAFRRLEVEGLIVSSRGRGRQVRRYQRLEWWPQRFEHKNRRRDLGPDSQSDAWMSDVAEQGRNGLQDIRPGTIKAPENIARLLNIEPGETILRRQRVRLLEGRRWQIADSHYPMWLTEGRGEILFEPGDVRVPGGFMAWLGHEQAFYEDTIIVRMPTEEECRRLEIDLTIPVMEHTRVGLDDEGTPVRVIVTIAPGDRHQVRYRVPAKTINFYVRPATEADIEAMTNLRAEAETWMHGAGIEQWVSLHHEQSRRLLEEAVENGTAWVVTEGQRGRVIATATIKGPDLDYWTPEDGLEDAVYIYKIIVSRDFKGQDLGGAILDWAGRRAARENRAWLRLDCRRDNTGLHDYYLHHGFELLRIMEEPLRPTELPRYTGALFQRPAGVETAATRLLEAEEGR